MLFKGANATGWIVFIGNLIHKITDGLVIGAGIDQAQDHWDLK